MRKPFKHAAANTLLFPLRHFTQYLQLRKAVILADRAHSLTKERYYVVPNADGKLIVIRSKEFHILRRKRHISQDMHMEDLITVSFYFTPYRDDSGTLTQSQRKEKILLFFKWAEQKKSMQR